MRELKNHRSHNIIWDCGFYCCTIVKMCGLGEKSEFLF